jgi:DNA invertase Pin-like site-specific DNA recombinase
MAKLIAYSYSRYSSDLQSKGDSLRRQEELAERVCKNKGWRLSPLERDEGVSGWDGSNIQKGALGDFVRDVESGKISTPCVLIIETFDRLTRLPVFDALGLFRKLLSLGVTICTAENGFEYTSNNAESLNNLLIPLVQMSMAHEHSERLSRRLRSSWQSKKEKARNEQLVMTRKLPAWITLPKGSTSTKDFKIDETKADIVRRIFREYLAGVGVNTIALKLTKEKIKPFGTGKTWNVSTVNRWLKSKVVIGHLQPHRYTKRNARSEEGMVIENYYPPVVSESDFYAAQELRDKRFIPRGPKLNRHNLFSGILFCKRCDSGMVMKTGAVTKKRTSPYRAIVCSNAMRGGKCKFAKIPYVHLEEILLQVMFNRILDSMDDFENTAEAKLQAIEGELADVTSQLEKMSILLDDPEVPKSKLLMSKIAELETRQEQLSGAKKLVPSDFSERRILERMRNWTPLENNQENRGKVSHLLRSLVEKVKLDAVQQIGSIHLRTGAKDEINEIRWDRKKKDHFSINGIQLPKTQSQVWLSPARIIEARKLKELVGAKPNFDHQIFDEYKVFLRFGSKLKEYRCVHLLSGCEYWEVLSDTDQIKKKPQRRFRDPDPLVKIQFSGVAKK